MRGLQWLLIGVYIGLVQSAAILFIPTDVIEGKAATLVCSAPIQGNLTYKWTLDDQLLRSSSRRFPNSSQLQIVHVDRSLDSGSFGCEVHAQGDVYRSNSSKLSFQWLGDKAVVQLMQPKKSDSDSNSVILKCQVNGSPISDKIHWFRNGEPLSKAEGISMRNRRLILRNPSVHENGVYSCEARNKAGKVTSHQNYALKIKSPLAAQIEIVPEDLFIRKGEDAVFNCRYNDAALQEWYRNNNGPLTNTSRITVHSNGSLEIKRVNDKDEGVYKCVGVKEDKSSVTQTYTARLVIAVLNHFSDDSVIPSGEVAAVRTSHDLELYCSAPKGDPFPRVWWEKEGEAVKEASGRSASLIIRKAQDKDSANYTCVAENVAGKVTAPVQVIVTRPPVLTAGPDDVRQREEHVVLLHCTHHPHYIYPVTRITWYKDDEVLRPSSFIDILSKGDLHIPRVRPIDSGEYYCEVSTQGFDSVRSRRANITVIERLKFDPQPRNTKLELDSEGKLACRAKGETHPVISWTKAGSSFPPWPGHVEDDNGILRFNGVRQSDAGNYTCTASTPTQGSIRAAISVSVIVIPTITLNPENFTEISEGAPLVLHCEASGIPPPAVQWDRDGRIINAIDPSRFNVLSNGTLWLGQVLRDDAGKYGCTAGNAGGFSREEVVLSVIARNATMGGEGMVMTKTITITVTAAAAYIGLVVGLMLWCRWRRIRKAREYRREMGENMPLNKQMNGDASELHGTSIHNANDSLPLVPAVLHKEDLNKVQTLGTGEFGEVWIAEVGENQTSTPNRVMVKCLQTRYDPRRGEFKRQADMFNKVRHETLSRMLAFFKEGDQPLLVLEYTDWGDLKGFLRTHVEEEEPIHPSHLLSLAHQLAIGMQHIANRRYVHRDLAARNCLISSKMKLKISYPALSKHPYQSDYFKFNDRVVPIRWMSPEAVTEEDYSCKSDVWSYACTVWEIYNGARLPFSELTNEEVLNKVSAQQLQWSPPPIPAPSKLQTMTAHCWSSCPKDRPIFDDIVEQLQQMTEENVELQAHL